MPMTPAEEKAVQATISSGQPYGTASLGPISEMGSPALSMATVLLLAETTEIPVKMGASV